MADVLREVTSLCRGSLYALRWHLAHESWWIERFLGVSPILSPELYYESLNRNVHSRGRGGGLSLGDSGLS